MCGIIGVIGNGEASPLLLDGLKRLAYRGYDSAGIATIVNGHIDRRRAEGKIDNLAALLDDDPLSGVVGIGHTRWATHGAPTTRNAHPHVAGPVDVAHNVAVVHNGIIENFQRLRDELTAEGRIFETDTDTEVVAHLVTSNMARGMAPVEAAAAMLGRLEGAFALGILFNGEDGLIVGARRGSPLAIGYGDGEMFLGSDAMALAPLTKRIAYLEEGDWVELRRDGAVIHDADGQVVEREIHITAQSGAAVGKDNYQHFMLKEIYEQPGVLGDTLNSFYQPVTGDVELPGLPFDLATLPNITIVACGTSYLAGLIAKFWLEKIARVPVEIDIASEFRYREAPMAEGGMALFISQSGETADTLAALRYCRTQGQHIVSLVNVDESTMARESDAILRTLAGPEIGVASTKAFTTQLMVLACLALTCARARGAIDHDEEARLSAALAEVPSRAAEVLHHDDRLRELAHDVAKADTVLYIGRGTGYPIAMEGALKLKELSYIHAEGFAAGELKHGPIALIEAGVPVIVVAPSDELFEKTASNMQEVIARGAQVVFLSDAHGVGRLGDLAAATIELPTVDPFVAPILYAIPVQLLAYHVAVFKGTDVDQPRNLAKSVTVE
jgi:glucosamine--fructose-6-phosphate aminotransferase (isomerizing)